MSGRSAEGQTGAFSQVEACSLILGRRDCMLGRVPAASIEVEGAAPTARRWLSDAKLRGP